MRSDSALAILAIVAAAPAAGVAQPVAGDADWPMYHRDLDGTRVPDFGDDGAVTLDVPYAGVPTIYRDVVIIGANFPGPARNCGQSACRTTSRRFLSATRTKSAASTLP